MDVEAPSDDALYRGTSLIRTSLPLGPYSRTMPRPLSPFVARCVVKNQQITSCGLPPRLAACRSRANSAQISRSRPDSGLGLTVLSTKVLKVELCDRTHNRCRAWREQLERFWGLSAERQDQILVVTVLSVLSLLDRGTAPRTAPLCLVSLSR